MNFCLIFSSCISVWRSDLVHNRTAHQVDSPSDILFHIAALRPVHHKCTSCKGLLQGNDPYDLRRGCYGNQNADSQPQENVSRQRTGSLRGCAFHVEWYRTPGVSPHRNGQLPDCQHPLVSASHILTCFPSSFIRKLTYNQVFPLLINKDFSGDGRWST